MMNIDDVPCVIATANVDHAINNAIADVDHATIFVVVVATDALVAHHVVVAAIGAAPPKAYENVAALESHVISAEYLHGGIVLLAVAVVFF